MRQSVYQLQVPLNLQHKFTISHVQFMITLSTFEGWILMYIHTAVEHSCVHDILMCTFVLYFDYTSISSSCKVPLCAILNKALIVYSLHQRILHTSTSHADTCDNGENFKLRITCTALLLSCRHLWLPSTISLWKCQKLMLVVLTLLHHKEFCVREIVLFILVFYFVTALAVNLVWSNADCCGQSFLTRCTYTQGINNYEIMHAL